MTPIDRTATLPCCALMLALAATTDAAAQSSVSDDAAATAKPEACAAISSDADRLVCYDKAVGRQAASPQAADSAADKAKARLDAMPASAGKKQAPQDSDTPFFVHDDQRDAIANAGKGSLLDSRWELAKDSKLGTFQLRAYKPVYLFPVFWTSKRNDFPASLNPQNTVTESRELDSTELKFQLSFKTKVAENLFGDNGDVWVGYTQSSRWQAYNSATSRPFRETNYEPEAMLVFRNNYSLLGWRGRLFGVGLNHQSNGQSDPLSRSWNRVIFDIGLDRGDWALMLRPWYRIKEDSKDDNNPHIDDYIGRGDATLVWHKDGHEVALMARHSFRGGDRAHGAVQLDWGFPINNLLRGHLQIFDGYGESMIDYNHRATYVGLGISLLEWY